MRVATIVAILPLAVTACSSSGGQSSGSTGNTSAGTEITALVVSSPSATALQKMAPSFTKKTGIKVNFIEVDYNASATKVLLSTRNNKAAYDVFQVDKPFFPQLGNAGALASLDDNLKNDKNYDTSDFSSQILEYQKYKGKTYGLALSTEPFVNWYRTDLFKTAGIQPPTTWKQYADASAALTAKGYYGSAFDYGPSQSAKYWASMLYENGGRLLNPETNAPELDTPVAKQTMQMYIDLAKQTPALAINGDAGAGAQQVPAFEQLQVGQMVQNSGWYTDLADPSKSKVVGKFAAAPLPSDKVGQYEPANLLYGWQLAIPSDSKKQAAAWSFMTYVLSKANVGQFIDAGAPPPGRTSTANNPEYAAKLPYLKVMIDEAANAVALPGIPDIAKVITLISQQISAMASDQVSVDQGLKNAQAAVTTALKQDGVLK